MLTFYTCLLYMIGSLLTYNNNQKLNLQVLVITLITFKWGNKISDACMSLVVVCIDFLLGCYLYC